MGSFVLLWWPCVATDKSITATFAASRRSSLACTNRRSPRTHLQESDTGNGIMPSYPDSSFPQSTVIGEEKSLSEPRADNHILTREIIVFSSRAGQLRVSDTNVTLLYASLPYMLRSSSACMLIAFPWTLIRRECRPPFKSLEITTGTFLHNLRFSG